MPTIFYSVEEHEAALAAANKNTMQLAQSLCVAKGYPCIRGPDDTPGGPGDSCDGCPSRKNCPTPFKRWSR